MNFDKGQKAGRGKIRDVTQKETENKGGGPRVHGFNSFCPKADTQIQFNKHSPDVNNVHIMALKHWLPTKGLDLLTSSILETFDAE